MLERALAYAAEGFHVFPCCQGKKTPLTENGCHDATTDLEQIRRWWGKWPRANIAIATGHGVVVLDFDVKEGKPGRETFQELQVRHGSLSTLIATTPSGGWHLWFRTDHEIRNAVDLLPGLDIRGSGGYVVVPPSMVDGKPYAWTNEDDIADLPASLLSLLTAREVRRGSPKPAADGIIPKGKRNAALTSLAGSMRRRGMGEAAIVAALAAENAEKCDPPLGEQEIRRIAASVARYPAEESKQAKPRRNQSKKSADFTDDHLALVFAERYRGGLRYCAQFGKWYVWSGFLWAPDEKLMVVTMSRAVCREAASNVSDESDQRRIRSKSTIMAVESLARSDQSLAVSAVDFDADPWKLNTPGGVVDLTTAALQSSDRGHLFTKATAVAPSDNLDCPLWLHFLDDVTDGNRELIGFLQRISGYGLTGETREHALFFFYGPGGNGKGVFLNTLTAILADYARTAPMTTFVETHGEAHPTDLAMLRGARLVTAQETKDGSQWAAGKIKQMTGGDPITARFMRQDFFTYTPQFKLFLAGNHKPALKTVDEAIRRRFHIIPFTVKIPEHRKDKQLCEKLKAEYHHILRWAIEGCLAWQRNGLNPPASVREATEMYLHIQDFFGQWIEERCAVGPNFWEKTDWLYADWKRYAQSHDEKPGKMNDFSEQLGGHGFHIGRDSARGRHCAGIKLRYKLGQDGAAEPKEEPS